MYLPQCRICKLQSFNICPKNHRKVVKSGKSVLDGKHFNEPNHNFQQHVEFTLIMKKLGNKQQVKRQGSF